MVGFPMERLKCCLHKKSIYVVPWSEEFEEMRSIDKVNLF